MPKDARLTILVETRVLRRLARLAADSDRSVAAEVRRAIDAYLEAQSLRKREQA